MIFMSSRALRVLCAAGPLLALAAAGPSDAEPIDSGVFRIYLRGRSMGVERFFFDQFADSIVVQSVVRQIILTPAGDDSLVKTSRLYVSAFDLDLRHYESTQKIAGHEVNRTLAMSDTAFVAYREEDSHGTGDVLVRPPGRIYVHDPDVYSLFDVISRNLYRQEFESRPITLLVLGRRDTTVEVTIRKLAPEPLRWGSRTVQAIRMNLDDGSNVIRMWSDARGRLLQLEEDRSRLRVVRDAPPVKPLRPRKTPPESNTHRPR